MSVANQLWLKYHETQDEELRGELITRYLPLVRLHAGRLALGLPPHVSRDDLVQSGVLGLMEALQRFDPSRNIKFETFAGRRIRGAMIDELRRLSWLPRSLTRQMRDFDTANQILAARLGREPNEDEMAAELGLSLADYRKAVSDINRCALLSLEDTLFPAVTDGPESSVLERMIGEEEKRTLAEAIASLPERHRLLLSLYYEQELTLKEIGLVLGVSESRVCQLHAKIITRLRSILSD